MKEEITKIQTEITCPNCKTQFDVANIKYAIQQRIEMAIHEVLKTI